ncbi:MAG: SixA phosphatase family protein [Candidatus Limnocylindrales bacterium]
MPSPTTQLHFLRHAHAGDPAKWAGPDGLRPLSTKGRHQAEALGRHLDGLGLAFDLLVSSPLVRARQTAELVGERLGLAVVIDERLAGGLDASGVAAILGEHGDPERPILVGHDPDFSELVAHFAGAGAIPMRKGALARIDIHGSIETGSAVLVFLLPPEIVGSA